VENFGSPARGDGTARSLPQGLNCESASAFGEFLSACSACAGDYEDPDRTAWSADLEDPEEDSDEFPAKEE